MKKINNFIIEKLRINKDTKSYTSKLVDVKINDPLYLLILLKRTKKTFIVNGKRIHRNSSRAKDEITWQSNDDQYNVWTFVQDVHFDNDSIIAGLITDKAFYFIAPEKEYFDELKNKELGEKIVNTIIDTSVKSAKQLKEFLDKNLKINR